MAFTSRTRLVNPRLGTYFGIFSAAFAAVVLMAMMFEQLGATDTLVRLLVFASPIALYACIGLLSATRETQDYFACGRRVPAFFNGLALATAALGGAGFLALTGAFFLIGFDALCLSIGWYAGLVFHPFVRAVPAQGRRLHRADLPRPPLRQPAGAGGGRRRACGADPTAAGGGGTLCRLCCGMAAGAVRAADGCVGRIVRGRDRDRRRHALADLVERGPGHRRAAGPGGVGH